MQSVITPLLLVLLLAALGAMGAQPLRPLYIRVDSPDDCRPIPTTNLAECAVKTAACKSKYDIPMAFYPKGDSCPPGSTGGSHTGSVFCSASPCLWRRRY